MRVFLISVCLAIGGMLGATTSVADEPQSLLRLFRDPQAFPTLVNPQCSHCRDEAKRRNAELRDDDRVLCWIRGYSDGGAIPIRFFLNPYRVISDTYGVFVYDPDAGYARGFAPSLEFSFYGWRNGVMVMQHKDGTLYSCLSGKAFDGPQKGTQLKAVPTLVSNWGDWIERYPQAVAYQMFDKYVPVDLPTRINEKSKDSRGNVDSRLAGDELVLGVAAGDAARAYRLKDLAQVGLINEAVAAQNRAILWDGKSRTAAAYLSIAGPPEKVQGESQSVTLRRETGDHESPFVDRETGSRWDMTGRAVEGRLKGWTLTWLDGTVVKWFAWAAEYPETSIYAPQPVQ
jgi:hypothetical protein